jgi:hypothetical protein
MENSCSTKVQDGDAAFLGAAGEPELFKTLEGQAYASITVGGHVETWALESPQFKDWLSRRYYLTEGKVPTRQKLSDLTRTLEGRALFEGETREVHLRLAEHEGDIYLDLTDRDWRIVRVTSSGWGVVAAKDAPVRFRRRKGMLAVPEPLRGGSVGELRPFVNVRDDDDWVLLVAWLVAALRPRGPYPVLALHGEQGSAKSTTSRVLASLIDPNTAALRSEPRDERDLMISATSRWLVTLDNLSQIPARLSDGLCRLATGGGFATRKLRTDDDEMIFNAQRPVVVNGIEEVVTRGDLLDRSLLVYLPSIKAEDRRPEEDMMTAFELARPRVLGALLDAVSAGLKNLPTVKVGAYTRLADFAKWVSAAEPSFASSGAFMRAYERNREEANDMVLESSPAGAAVLEFMRARTEHTTTAGDLLCELNMKARDEVKKDRAWPKTPKGMSDALRRVAPNLYAEGVLVEFGKRREGGTGRRLVTLTRVFKQPSRPSQTPPERGRVASPPPKTSRAIAA